MIESALKQFGLSEKEIAVYLALLKLGSAPVRKISEQAGTNRTTAHDILGQLMAEGLVSFVDKAKHRYFAAEPPENLLTALKTKRNKLDAVESNITQVLPELKSLYEKSPAKPKAKYFEGEAGLRAILQDVLESAAKTGEKQYYVYSSSSIRDALHRAYPEFNAERKKLKIRVQAVSIGEGGQLHGLDERKWLAREQGAPTYTILYAGKIALISLGDNKDPLGVVVEDANTYKTQEMIFQFVWKKL